MNLCLHSVLLLCSLNRLRLKYAFIYSITSSFLRTLVIWIFNKALTAMCHFCVAATPLCFSFSVRTGFFSQLKSQLLFEEYTQLWSIISSQLLRLAQTGLRASSRCYIPFATDIRWCLYSDHWPCRVGVNVCVSSFSYSRPLISRDTFPGSLNRFIYIIFVLFWWGMRRLLLFSLFFSCILVYGTK